MRGNRRFLALKDLRSLDHAVSVINELQIRLRGKAKGEGTRDLDHTYATEVDATTSAAKLYNTPHTHHTSSLILNLSLQRDYRLVHYKLAKT
ncbi:hypothetical protein KQX54_020811 [Cotesia glomerata]|uniref:Uncharacterized protein n=1 Tax=Cotesia glomerata TaxID=32391 RepID=A0AAV7HMB8_COTGL|nr:hypothetical protein KQX54_020811 [Cotesia glomerata]